MASVTPLLPPLRLLHLEDNPADAGLIHAQIGTEWPDSVIKLVDNRAAFKAAIDGEDFDLILSDYSLPSFNGLEALALVRERGLAMPFLFLSGTIGEDYAVAALQQGAADYLLKDRPARLIPAIRAALEQRREHKLRQMAEQRLREQAEVLDKARDAICVTDLAGRVTYWNQSASELFGWSGEAGRSHTLQAMFGLFNQGLLPGALRELHAQGAWTRELQLTAGKDDQLRYIVSRWTLVRDKNDRPKSILIINTDITEEKKLEAQLLRAQRLEGIGTLAGGIAHDLNNVLAPILMAVNLLQLQLSDEKLLRLVGVLEKSAQHGAELIRQVLAFARGAEGARAEIQPQLVIKDVVMLLSETLPRAIAIETGIAPELWLVLANSTQLSQVLMNLGVNARDAMPAGGRLLYRAANVTVDHKLALANPGAQAGPHVLITVADTGSGIAPELINRIFDPFFTTKVAGKGTGLGLSTVLGIIKGHGGFLHVQSEPGRGTEFHLYFPAIVNRTKMPSISEATRPPRGQGETILVIDDEFGVREVAATILRSYGYNVLVAESGPTGLALYREHRGAISVVVTDMMMPAMQGSDVIQELRRLNPDVGVVAMSGVVIGRTEITEEPGRLVFLPKPMTGEDLVLAAQRVLSTAPSLDS